MALEDEGRSSSVTVSVRRKVNPSQTKEVNAWIQSGVNLADGWPGFLGSGWIRSSSRSDEWYMLYRFADAASLAGWENSNSRRQWLDQGKGLVEERRVQKLTGIEGWFDSDKMPEVDPEETRPASRPPRWKQAVSVWLAFFPVSLVFALIVEALFPAWGGLGTITRVFITTTVLTPVMTVWVLPWITRVLYAWLTGDEAVPKGAG